MANSSNPARIVTGYSRQSAVQGLPRKLPRAPGARAYHRRAEDTAGHRTSPRCARHCASTTGWSTPNPRSAGPQQIIDYLGRYTHRIAISNHRILNLADGKVTFTWKDYKDGAKTKVMTLDANEFIRRFTLHILPPRFTASATTDCSPADTARPSSIVPKRCLA